MKKAVYIAYLYGYLFGMIILGFIHKPDFIWYVCAISLLSISFLLIWLIQIIMELIRKIKNIHIFKDVTKEMPKKEGYYLVKVLERFGKKEAKFTEISYCYNTTLNILSFEHYVTHWMEIPE